MKKLPLFDELCIRPSFWAFACYTCKITSANLGFAVATCFQKSLSVSQSEFTLAKKTATEVLQRNINHSLGNFKVWESITVHLKCPICSSPRQIKFIGSDANGDYTLRQVLPNLILSHFV